LHGNSLAKAQTGTMERAHQVQGVVRSGEAPAAGAYVVLEQRGFVRGQGFTDADGKFSFSRVGPGEYILVASKDGYRTTRMAINIINSSLIGLSITLHRESKEAPAGPPTVNLEALALSPEARRHQEQGLKELSQGRWEASLASFRQVVALHPDFAGAHLGLGMAHYFLRQLEAAEPALRRSLELDKNLPLAYVFLGRLLNDQGRSREAQEALGEALARGPDRWDVYYELARALAIEGKFAAAEKKLRDAHALDPVGANLHLLLVDLLLLRDERKEALAEMRHYLELHPTGSFASQVRRRAESLAAELRDSKQPN
jgi:tetratricopeptide (TPR) repeat protein